VALFIKCALLNGAGCAGVCPWAWVDAVVQVATTNTASHRRFGLRLEMFAFENGLFIKPLSLPEVLEVAFSAESIVRAT
jgi:hypothetical protein